MTLQVVCLFVFEYYAAPKNVIFMTTNFYNRCDLLPIEWILRFLALSQSAKHMWEWVASFSKPTQEKKKLAVIIFCLDLNMGQISKSVSESFEKKPDLSISYDISKVKGTLNQMFFCLVTCLAFAF